MDTGKNISSKPDYDHLTQLNMLSHLIADKPAFDRCKHILDAEYFDSELRKHVRFIVNYEREHNELPTGEILAGKLNIHLPSVTITPATTEWLLGEVEGFCRYKALELRILDSLDLLQKGKADEIERGIVAANAIKLSKQQSPFLSIKDVVSRPPIEWLIDGIIPERSFVVLYGQPGTCKSFVATSIGMTLAEGLPWKGLAQSPRGVVYVAAEGEDGNVTRFAAWYQHHKREYPKHNHFVCYPKPISLMEQSSAVHEFIRDCQDHEAANGIKIELIIIDTLARCMVGANESSQEHMSVAIESADTIKKTLGCTVLIVHHTTKNGEGGPRGSSALNGAADAVISVTRNGSKVMLKGEKIKYASADDATITFDVVPTKLPKLPFTRAGRMQDSLCLVLSNEPSQPTVEATTSTSRDMSDARLAAQIMVPGTEYTMGDLIDLMREHASDMPLGKYGYERIKIAVPEGGRMVPMPGGVRLLRRTGNGKTTRITCQMRDMTRDSNDE